ncbi:MAG: hypothetical protein LBU11_04955 [Zoogloeaceae bacterium]|jgi:hypothetical protein|nr:hypothetical protein [Zoogloeaceae bacterium]
MNVEQAAMDTATGIVWDMQNESESNMWRISNLYLVKGIHEKSIFGLDLRAESRPNNRKGGQIAGKLCTTNFYEGKTRISRADLIKVLTTKIMEEGGAS